MQHRHEGLVWPRIEVEGYEKSPIDIRPKSIVDPSARRSDISLLLMKRTTYVPKAELDEAEAELEEEEARTEKWVARHLEASEAADRLKDAWEQAEATLKEERERVEAVRAVLCWVNEGASIARNGERMGGDEMFDRIALVYEQTAKRLETALTATSPSSDTGGK